MGIIKLIFGRMLAPDYRMLVDDMIPQNFTKKLQWNNELGHYETIKVKRRD